MSGQTFVDRLRARRPLLCDGAMGTMFYARGVFINRSYDELNLSEPLLVRELHEEYLLSGAELVETNTFGANSVRLRRFDLQGKVAEINAAGVRLAREAVNLVREKHAHEAWVAGSIGSLGLKAEDAAVDAEAVYAEQVEALHARAWTCFLLRP